MSCAKSGEVLLFYVIILDQPTVRLVVHALLLCFVGLSPEDKPCEFGASRYCTSFSSTLGPLNDEALTFVGDACRRIKQQQSYCTLGVTWNKNLFACRLSDIYTVYL